MLMKILSIMIYVDEIERDTSLKSENEERKQKISVLKKKMNQVKQRGKTKTRMNRRTKERENTSARMNDSC